jgi:hypothetical protein
MSSPWHAVRTTVTHTRLCATAHLRHAAMREQPAGMLALASAPGALTRAPAPAGGLRAEKGQPPHRAHHAVRRRAGERDGAEAAAARHLRRGLLVPGAGGCRRMVRRRMLATCAAEVGAGVRARCCTRVPAPMQVRSVLAGAPAQEAALSSAIASEARPAGYQQQAGVSAAPRGPSG